MRQPVTLAGLSLDVCLKNSDARLTVAGAFAPAFFGAHRSGRLTETRLPSLFETSGLRLKRYAFTVA